MIVANHTSMADIMLMLAITRILLFCRQKELSKNSFGFFLQKNLHLGWQGSTKKNGSFDRAQKNQSRLSICIFSEGGVPDDESILLDTFKDGAFRLAIEHQIPIVPIIVCR
jgi:1-acyl-sn-glycerol-3-phosphate acyltransferase